MVGFPWPFGGGKESSPTTIPSPSRTNAPRPPFSPSTASPAVSAAHAARGDAPVRVDPQLVQQTWQGWGTSLCWWANVVGAFPAQERDRILDLLFDRDAGLGLEIVRYNVGGSGWDSRDARNLRAGANVESLLAPFSYRKEKGKTKKSKDNDDDDFDDARSSSSPPHDQWRYDWRRDEAQRLCLLGARDRGAHVFEAFANSPPYFMTRSGRASGASCGCVPNLPRDRIDDFARYLVDVVAHYRAEHDVAFTSIAPFNEPREVCWWAGTNQEGCRFRLPDQRRVVRRLAARLKEAGLTADCFAAGNPSSASASASSSSKNGDERSCNRRCVRIAVSDENRIDRALSSLEATLGRRLVVRYRRDDGRPYAKLKGLSAEELSLVGHVSTHAYSGLESRLPLRVVAEAAGVDVWMSEVGFGSAPPSSPASATLLAGNVAADVNRMRCCAWVYWQGVEDSDGGSWRGLLRLRPVSSLGFRALFALQQKYYSVKQGLAAAAVRRKILKESRRKAKEKEKEKEKKKENSPSPSPSSSSSSSSSKESALEEAERAASEYRRPWWGLLLVSFGAPRKAEEEGEEKGEGAKKKNDASPPPPPRDVTSELKDKGIHPAIDKRDALSADQLVISKQFYGLKQFSRHIRSGDGISAVPWDRADDVVVAFSRDGARAVCVAVNNDDGKRRKEKEKKEKNESSSSPPPPYFSPSADGSRKVAFDLGPFLRAAPSSPSSSPPSSSSKKKRGGAKVRVFLTDAGRDAEEVEELEVRFSSSSSSTEGGGGGGSEVAALLVYTLPPLSVATFVVERH